MILEDLRSIGGRTDDQYDLVPLSPSSLLADNPSDFLVQAEDYGVPQRRHRIVIVGVRRDVARRCWDAEGIPMLRRAGRSTTVRDVIGGLPAIRSGLSKEPDEVEAWRTVVSEVAEFLAGLPETAVGIPLAVEGILAELPKRIATGCSATICVI